MRRIILILLAAATQLLSQVSPPQAYILVSADPSGSCRVTQAVRWSYNTSSQWYCDSGTLMWTEFSGGGGAGTVTVVGGGSLTSTALVTGGGTTTLQTPSATSTLDSSGNLAVTSVSTGTSPPAITVGTAGVWGCKEGTAPTGLADAAMLYCSSDATKILAILNNGSPDEVCFLNLANCGGGAAVTSVSDFSALPGIGVADMLGGTVTEGLGYAWVQKYPGTLLSFTYRTGTITGGTAMLIAIYNAACTSLLGFARNTTLAANSNVTTALNASLALTAGTVYNLVFFSDSTTFEIQSFNGLGGWGYASSPNAFKTTNTRSGTGVSMTAPATCGTKQTISFLPSVAPVFNY